MTGQEFGVCRTQLLIFGIGLSGLRFAIRRYRSGMFLLSSVSKSVGAAVTAGEPSVGSVGISVGQHPVQPETELEDDTEFEEAGDEVLEDGEDLMLPLVVCEAILSEADFDGSSSGSVSSARVLRSSRRSSVKSGSGVSFPRLSFNEVNTSSAQPMIFVISPAKFSRPVKGFDSLFLLFPAPHEPVISVPPRSLKRSSALLIVFSISFTSSALIVGIVRSTP